MDRQIVFPGALPQDTDVLLPQLNAMVNDGALAEMVLGTSPVVDGLTLTPTTPASMSVLVQPGSITAYSEIDATQFGSVAANSASLVKIGVSLTPTTLNLAAPSIAGQEIVYVIQASFSEIDVTPTVVPYFNAQQPSQPFLGPNGSGGTQYTQRKQIVQVQAKPSAPANNPPAPTVDNGWISLGYVTVPYGATTVTDAMIAHVFNAALPIKLPEVSRGVQTAISLSGQAFDPRDPTQLWQAMQRAATDAALSTALGYVPVRQAGTDAITLGWDGSYITASVNGNSQGQLATHTWVAAGYQPLGTALLLAGGGTVTGSVTLTGTVNANQIVSRYGLYLGPDAIGPLIYTNGPDGQTHQLNDVQIRTGTGTGTGASDTHKYFDFGSDGSLYVPQDVIGHAGKLLDAADFPFQITGNGGWSRLSNGLILQWGQVSLGTAGMNYYNLPTTFPNQFLSITGGEVGVDGWSGGGGPTFYGFSKNNLGSFGVSGVRLVQSQIVNYFGQTQTFCNPAYQTGLTFAYVAVGY